MPLFRFRVDQPEKIYQALVVATEAARESPVAFDVGPWDDQELRELAVIEISGPDEAAELVVNRWIDAAIGFEYADDLAVG